MSSQLRVDAGSDLAGGAASHGDAGADVAQSADTGKGRKTRPLGPLAALKPYIWRYKPTVAAAIASLLLSAGATLAVPLAVRRMIDMGFGQVDPGLMDKYFGMLVVVGLVLAVASAARFYTVNLLGERVIADVRRDVFQHLTRLSPSFYEATHSGEVNSRLTADTTQIKAAVGSTASQALRNFVLLIGAVGLMIFTSAKLSLLVLIAIPVIVLPLMASGRAVRKLSRSAQDTLADAAAYASEALSGVRTLQAAANERYAANRYGAAVMRAYDAARSRMKARAVLTAIAIFLVFASIVAVLWYGASDVMAGKMTAGHLSQFVLYAVLAAASLGELSEVWGEVQQTAGSAERLIEILAVEPEIVSPENPVALPEPPRGEIAFDDVSFAYPTRRDTAALDHVSFAIAPSERVAIVGPSGAGKSTIFSLLLRFYDPVSGSVRVDGVGVDEAGLEAVRKRFALVPQDTVLFADTVAENIRYGVPHATDEEVRDAARAAFAHDFIEALPDRYETKLGERGVMLSGGQRQRVAIARAVLRNAPILLLDEATSALDAESETLVQKALEQVMQGRTSLVIAHRLATVRNADRILVMDDGRIVEQGTHETLSRAGGVYARLAALQFDDAGAG